MTMIDKLKNKKGHARTLIRRVRISVSFAKAKDGFTLLFSLLILTMILSASLGVYGIVARQYKISQISRESSRAFFASDAGLECAIYWDKKGAFDVDPYNINCLGQSKGGNIVTPITFYLDLNDGACAKVVIDKSNPEVVLSSYGYNEGEAGSSCSGTGKRKFQVERLLQYVY